MSNPALFVEARWSSPYSVDAWARMLAVRAQADTVADGDKPEEVIVIGPALPSDEERRVAHMVAFRESDNLIGWLLTLRMPPDDAPPKDVRDGDALLGGWRGLAKLVAEALSGHNVKCDYHIVLHLPATEWSCRLLPRPLELSGPENDVTRINGPAFLEQVGYRFTEQSEGVTEVSVIYDHRRDRFHVAVRAVRELVLQGATWLPDADKLFEIARAALFSKKGPPS